MFSFSGNNRTAFKTYALVAGLAVLASCGKTTDSSNRTSNSFDAKEHVEKYSQSADSKQSNKPTAKLDGVTIIPIKCNVKKTNLAFANGVTQDLFGRPANKAESDAANAANFDRKKFVEDAVASSEASNGISRFVANLLVLHKIIPRAFDNNTPNEEIVAEASLVTDLQKEPVELVLRNRDKPWDWFFTTRDIYCTKHTAKLYKAPVIDSGNFVACKLPEDRAGFLGLASVLRASPSNMYSTNNNYHRVAYAMYLAQGFKLLSATNGPTGDSGAGLGLPSCVPTTDTRKDPNGLVFGTAAIPAVGPVCASCHSRYNGPISVAFRRFDSDGSSITFERIDALTQAERNGATQAQLKQLLNESNSCWSFDGIAPPRSMSGVPGLGRLIAESGTLGRALGVQIPQNLANIEPDANISSTIEKSFNENGKTLPAALKGFFLSDSYQCAEKGE